MIGLEWFVFKKKVAFCGLLFFYDLFVNQYLKLDYFRRRLLLKHFYDNI
jgi:hypothetical protein